MTWRALANGASGYLLKTAEGNELVDAIERVQRGESVVSPEMTGKLVAAYRQALASATEALPPGGALTPPVTSSPLGHPEPASAPSTQAAPVPAPGPLSRLSPRERDILREIARGASNKEIARTLDIAETTVKIHVQHILRKLNLTSRVQAAVMASSDMDQV